MKTVFHSASSRGHADHGWLDTYHTFSFARYYNPDRMNFGALRVLNDDRIEGGTGFGTHPHENMEIITIPLKGALEHADSMGNRGVIRKGEVQVMSAGTGIQHSEFNHLKDEDTEILQIWVFPKADNIKPRYEQIKTNIDDRKNEFVQIVSPDHDDEGARVHQDTWFSLARIDTGRELVYKLKNSNKNGVYAFLIDGDMEIADHRITDRDGLGIYEIDQLTFKARKNSFLLVTEVPMSDWKK